MTTSFRSRCAGRCGVLFFLLVAPDCRAATVLSKKVAVEILAGGVVRERTELEVRLEDPGDLEAWSSYPVYLDEHRRLTSFEAWVVDGAGRRRKVERKQQDRVEYSGDGIVESSQYFHVAELPGLSVGTVLDLAHSVEVEPYFPSGQMTVLSPEPISELELTVRGDGLRWRLDGPAVGLEVEERDGGVRVTGRDLAAVETVELAAGGAASQPILRYSWGEDASWEAVGRWYRHLLSGLPRDPPEIRELAAELTGGLQEPRQRLEALLAYLRQKVRYVAVEVGIGGYRPSPPAEVLSRKWGDCKDKSLLLVDLLRQVGIAAYPALILSARDRRIETAFPSPSQFNHLIVAVPRDAVATGDGDPVADGYLFLDPTQTLGSARWLHPGVQDQDALIVTEDGGFLARTPLQPRHENRFLAVDLKVSPEGNAAGRAGLLLEGSVAVPFLQEMKNAPPEQMAENALSIFNGLLPGARLSEVSWGDESGDVPAVRIALTVEIDALVQGSDERASLRLPGLRITPESRLFDELESAAAQPARQARTLWRLTFPEGWCPPLLGKTEVESSVGSFVQEIGRDAEGRFTVERRTEIRRRWIEVEDLGALKELALAEHHAATRRIRLRCGEGSSRDP